MMNDDIVAANPFDSGEERPVSGALISAEMQKAITEVQAALVMARAHPRDPRRAMDRIIQDCMRASLAEESTYQYSRGGTYIAGPSIRLAETIAKRWGNMEAGVKELSRRDGVSECLAYAWDYETNYRDVRAFTVRHWRDTKSGGYAVRDERSIYELVANAGARRKRGCILALIDGDVVEAATKQCELTLQTKVEITDALLADALAKFEAFGVTRTMIEARIQRHYTSITPALMVSLRKIYNSLRDGMSAPADWFEMGDTPAASVTQPPASRSPTDTIKTQTKTRRRKTAENVMDVDKAQASTPAIAQRDVPRPAAQPKELSYAAVADAINTAQDSDALAAAAELIRYVADDGQRSELTAAYSDRLQKFEG